MDVVNLEGQMRRAGVEGAGVAPTSRTWGCSLRGELYDGSFAHFAETD
jgi:hypothetical protein